MARREFEIAFVGLKPGIHEYSYKITDKFFTDFQQQDFRNCQANVKLLLDKKSGFMQLKFEIGGSLDVNCDRCNNNISLDLWDDFTITLKMVEEPELMNNQEDDPDVYYIGRGESHLELSNWIYEFINLSIPMTKICGENEQGDSLCNKEVLEALKQLKQGEEKENKSNPIWKGLEKFKDLDN